MSGTQPCGTQLNGSVSLFVQNPAFQGHFLQKHRSKFLADSIAELFEAVERKENGGKSELASGTVPSKL